MDNFYLQREIIKSVHLNYLFLWMACLVLTNDKAPIVLNVFGSPWTCFGSSKETYWMHGIKRQVHKVGRNDNERSLVQNQLLVTGSVQRRLHEERKYTQPLLTSQADWWMCHLMPFPFFEALTTGGSKWTQKKMIKFLPDPCMAWWLWQWCFRLVQ